MCKRALGIKFGEQSTKLFIRGGRVVWNLVFAERGHHPLTREHGRALYNRGRTDAVYANLGRKGNREFTNKMIDRRLAQIVSLASMFGNDCIGRACEHHARVEP